MSETPGAADRQIKKCWQCGRGFTCGAESKTRGCWCEALPSLAPKEGADCLCPFCLAAAIRAPAPRSVAGPLVENADYYRDGGNVVFTAAYHLRRGYCCNSGCRHCPYG